jgi:hypothetical protein
MLIALSCLAIVAIILMLSVSLSLFSKDPVDYREYATVRTARKRRVAQTKTVVSRDHGSAHAVVEGPNRSGSTVVASPAPEPEVVSGKVTESAPESAPEVQHINDETAPKFAEFGDNATGAGKEAA